jgi:PKD repeat protein
LSFLIDGASSWFWDFGDGQTSTEQNPTHTYAEGGVYDVLLTVESPECGVITTVYHICVGEGGGVGANCQAFFFFEQPDVDNLLFFQFIDFSLTGTGDTWIWDFGDGQTSTEQNPTHTYAEAGIYTVTLSVIDGDCNSTVSIIVNAGENYWYGDLACRAWFLPIITSPTYEVFFINLSSADAIAFIWDFGDGTSSTDPLAFHTYPGPGIYTVTLTTTSADGCTNTFTTIINLTEGEGGFTSNPSFSLVSDTEEVVELSTLQVAPNPTRDQVQISWQPNVAGGYTWQLFDLNGRLIEQQQLRTSGALEIVTLDLSAQVSGVYLFRLQTAEGQQTIRLSKL